MRDTISIIVHLAAWLAAILTVLATLACAAIIADGNGFMEDTMRTRLCICLLIVLIVGTRTEPVRSDFNEKASKIAIPLRYGIEPVEEVESLLAELS
jgi:hypothetical protein